MTAVAAKTLLGDVLVTCATEVGGIRALAWIMHDGSVEGDVVRTRVNESSDPGVTRGLDDVLHAPNIDRVNFVAKALSRDGQ